MKTTNSTLARKSRLPKVFGLLATVTAVAASLHGLIWQPALGEATSSGQEKVAIVVAQATKKKLDVSGARRFAAGWNELKKATGAMGSLQSSATAEQKARARKTAEASLEKLKSAGPALKRDVRNFVAELKKSGDWEILDQEIYAKPGDYGSTSGELQMVRSAGGPKAVLEQFDLIVDEELLYFEEEIRPGRSAFRIDLSLISEAHAGFGCSLVVWGSKVIFAWSDSTRDAFATRNYQYCM